ncbi:MAG: LysM peptidoglycan-binding domain-containing protein [Lachnospiraceae bacterium]|jgi:spore germination protein|nr:LysM peptidoglycan-binding domain-containing protein [Lachnospiraceae bacterium]
MIIHVVQPGETIHSIAELYGISEEWLIRENGIDVPNQLVVGDTYVILFPEVVYTVMEGDTIESIAEAFDVTVMELLRNNTYLADQGFLYPGDSIVIRYTDQKIGSIAVNGFAYPFINLNILRKTLPFLTYLTIYRYTITPEGELTDINDTAIIQIAKEYGVAPIMQLSFEDMTATDGNDFGRRLLTEESVQNQFIAHVIYRMEAKGYMGLSFNSRYIYPTYRQLYIDFIHKLALRLEERGLLTFIILNPNAFELISGVMYSMPSTFNPSTILDGSILLTYEMGMVSGFPVGAIDFHTVKELVQRALEILSPEKVQFGISTVGYLWELPYKECISQGNAISNAAAVQLARSFDIPIQYDTLTESALFTYSEFGREFFVRFKDARSMNAYIQLVEQYELNAISVWNIMTFFYSLWLIINSRYNIIKII